MSHYEPLHESDNRCSVQSVQSYVRMNKSRTGPTMVKKREMLLYVLEHVVSLIDKENQNFLKLRTKHTTGPTTAREVAPEWHDNQPSSVQRYTNESIRIMETVSAQKK